MSIDGSQFDCLPVSPSGVNPCAPFSLDIGEQLEIRLGFCPPAVDSVVGTLTIRAGGESRVVELMGVGTP